MEEKKYSNITDYVSSEFRSFSALPLNEVDLAAFAKFSYFNFQVYLPKMENSIRLKDMYDISKKEAFLKINAPSDEDERFFNSITGNPRYSNITVLGFKDTFEKDVEQFSAVSFLLPNDTFIVAFRGTDSTWTGWKEDFEMAIKAPINSQKEATEYLNYILTIKRKFKNGVYVIGHSKGGNLAVYSYLTCNAKQANKITDVYSFDGPGINNELTQALRFSERKGIIKKFVPVQSIIGQIYDVDDKYKVVEANDLLLKQHSFYNWKVDLNNDCFITGIMSDNTKKNVRFLNEWIVNASYDEKELIVETIYQVLTGTEVPTMAQLGKHKISSFIKVYQQIGKLDPKTKKQFKTILKNSYHFLKDFNKEDKEAEEISSKDEEIIKELNQLYIKKGRLIATFCLLDINDFLLSVVVNTDSVRNLNTRNRLGIDREES